MRDNILATDLQHHFDILPALRNIAERKFLSRLMTALSKTKLIVKQTYILELCTCSFDECQSTSLSIFRIFLGHNKLAVTNIFMLR